jgi:hypothetical protein
MCDDGISKDRPMRYFKGNLFWTVNMERKDVCICIYYWGLWLLLKKLMELGM